MSLFADLCISIKNKDVSRRSSGVLSLFVTDWSVSAFQTMRAFVLLTAVV